MRFQIDAISANEFCIMHLSLNKHYQQLEKEIEQTTEELIKDETCYTQHIHTYSVLQAWLSDEDRGYDDYSYNFEGKKLSTNQMVGLMKKANKQWLDLYDELHAAVASIIPIKLQDRSFCSQVGAEPTLPISLKSLNLVRNKSKVIAAFILGLDRLYSVKHEFAMFAIEKLLGVGEKSYLIDYKKWKTEQLTILNLLESKKLTELITETVPKITPICLLPSIKPSLFVEVSPEHIHKKGSVAIKKAHLLMIAGFVLTFGAAVALMCSIFMPIFAAFAILSGTVGLPILVLGIVWTVTQHREKKVVHSRINRSDQSDQMDNV